MLSKVMALTLAILMLTFPFMTSCGPEETDEVVGNGDIFDPTKTWNVYEEGHLVSAPVEINYWSANSAVDVHGKTMSELVDEFNAYQKATYCAIHLQLSLTIMLM